MKKFIYLASMILVICFAMTPLVYALDAPIVKYPEAVYIYVDNVAKNEWYINAREFVVGEGIMGRTCTKIIPETNEFYFDFFGERSITRSEVATILSRYNGSYDTIDAEKYNGTTCPAFVDVPDGQWYTPAADWAYENGIVNGVGGTYFAPERTITREEFAAMLYRYTEYLEVDTSARVDYSEFADSESVSEWAHDAMSWAVAEGLINGKPGKLLAPQDTITRAEVATVIYRYNNEVKAHRDIWDGK